MKKAVGKAYTPTQVANAGLAHIEYVSGNPGVAVDIHLPFMRANRQDPYVRPLFPGRPCSVQAGTGHGKTSFMLNWARWLAASAMPGEMVVYVDPENPIETHALRAYMRATGESYGRVVYGQADVQLFRDVWSNVVSAGLYIVGTSIGAEANRTSDGLYGMTVHDALDAISNLLRVTATDAPNAPTRRVKAIFFDYITAFARDAETGRSNKVEEHRHIQVGRDMGLIIQRSMELGAPVVVGAQSRRDQQHNVARADGGLPILCPNPTDVGDSYAVSQMATTILSLWKPTAAGHAVGSPVSGGYTVADDLFFVKVTKQNMGAVGATWGLRLDYTTGEFALVPPVV